MTETTMDIIFDEGLYNTVPNFTLEDVLEKSFEKVGIPEYTAEERAYAKAYKDTRAYRNSICQNIPLAYERLKDVKVLNMDGIDLLDKIKDNDKAFAFVDPPYKHDLRGKNADKSYACELPHREQIRLLKTIRHAKCKIMLCGYKSEEGEDLYDRYLLPHGWKCYKLADLTKSCQTKEKKDKGKEYIWVNYELPEKAKYAISMKTHSTL